MKTEQSGFSAVAEENSKEKSAAKKLPIGLTSFEKIITENYVYVDKTQIIANLCDSGVYYFLSRPRRFGKTLFLDTLKQAFLGNMELFKGLYLENNWDWSKKHPVIHISLAVSSAINSEKVLLDTINNQLDAHAKQYGIELPNHYSYEVKFDILIKGMANLNKSQKTVVLIDEYDKPILDVIDNTKEALRNRELLKSLYGVIKNNDEHLKFVLLTGVTKFAKAGIFSHLNNLNDITFNEKYADICGYTQNDIETTFKDYLVGVDLPELRRWYNGYNFLGNDGQKVYNPFDILLFINNGKKYKNYWFETGTPSFLIKLLQKKQYYVPKLEGLKLTDSAIGSFDIENLSIEVLLLQAGYLTITQAAQDSTMGIILYTLDYPNFEVKQSLADRILADMFGGNNYTVGYHLQMSEKLNNNDMEGAVSVLKSFLSSIPHDWYRNTKLASYEGYYCSVVYTFFNAMGLYVIPEDNTSFGQIDLTLKLADKILILEFKLLKNGNAASALKQIKDKKYADKYKSSDKPIYLIGISFDNKSRSIHDFIVEKLL